MYATILNRLYTMVSKICVSSEVKQIDDASFLRRLGGLSPSMNVHNQEWSYSILVFLLA